MSTVTSTPTTPSDFPPVTDPPNGPVTTAGATTILDNQLSADDIATTSTAAMDDAANTASGIRNSIYGTMHGIAEQAQSSAEEQIGDEISQSKKSVDNASKAV